MSTIIDASAPQSRAHPPLDLDALKARQQGVWASGDYAVVGTTLQIVGESLCEAIDLRAGSTVLDVAAGNGNAALAAARRWCEVTATDYVPELLGRARERAAAERLALAVREADAEALPFPDERFDAVLSTFGVMFTPNQARAARELLRVCRRGGRIGLANWTPDGFIGQVFRTIGRHLPPPPGAPSPAAWGMRAHLDALFGHDGVSITAKERDFVFRYRSIDHWLDVFATTYGPILKAFAALEGQNRAALRSDLIELVGRFNRSGDGSVAVPSAYLEVVIARA